MSWKNKEVVEKFSTLARVTSQQKILQLMDAIIFAQLLYQVLQRLIEGEETFSRCQLNLILKLNRLLQTILTSFIDFKYNLLFVVLGLKNFIAFTFSLKSLFIFGKQTGMYLPTYFLLAFTISGKPVDHGIHSPCLIFFPCPSN